MLRRRDTAQRLTALGTFQVRYPCLVKSSPGMDKREYTKGAGTNGGTFAMCHPPE